MRSDISTDIQVLDENGKNLGRMSYKDAKFLAQNKNLDLVQINKNEHLPVYKIMDHGKWKYEKKKQQQHQHQKSPVHQTKEMAFKMRIDSHDQEIKINHIKEFLARGLDVKIMVTMKGREKASPQMANEKMDQILESLSGLFQVSARQGTPSSVSVLVRPQTHSTKKA